MLVHLKTTRGLYEQLSVICLWAGNARLVDQDEPGFERLSSTSSSTISASTRRGTFQVASTREDGYVQSWTRHSMMMMMGRKTLTCNQFFYRLSSIQQWQST